MGVLGGIKKALSAISRFDRNQVYGSDVEDKMATLGRLSQIHEQGLQLENQGKFEDIQRMRDDLQERNLKNATALQSQIGDDVDPTFVGPRLEEAGLPNPTGEGHDNTALDAFHVPEKLRGAVRMAGGRAREQQDLDNAEKSARTNAMIENLDARTQEAISKAKKNDRTPVSTPGGTGQKDRFPVLQYRDGKPGYYDRVTNTFTALPEGAVPGNVNLPQGLSGDLAGLDAAQQQLGTLQLSLEKAKGQLGPGVGQLKWAAGRFAGGAGLNPAVLDALNEITRTTYNAAFEQGGKTLTKTELEAFKDQMPQEGDTFDYAARKIVNAVAWLETKRNARLATMSPGQRQVYGSGRKASTSTVKPMSAREKAIKAGLLPHD